MLVILFEPEIPRSEEDKRGLMAVIVRSGSCDITKTRHTINPHNNDDNEKINLVSLTMNGGC